LNRLSRNLDALDESIESVRKMPKGEKPAERRARLKLLRDLVELQNCSLTSVKTHLLGRDETGASREPADYYDSNDQIEFERYFKTFLGPAWTKDDLKIECRSCGECREDVSAHYFPEIRDADFKLVKESETLDLCPKCYEKRSVIEKNETDGRKDPPDARS
jgi:hypothetical protein